MTASPAVALSINTGTILTGSTRILTFRAVYLQPMSKASGLQDSMHMYALYVWTNAFIHGFSNHLKSFNKVWPGPVHPRVSTVSQSHSQPVMDLRQPLSQMHSLAVLLLRQRLNELKMLKAERMESRQSEGKHKNLNSKTNKLCNDGAFMTPCHRHLSTGKQPQQSHKLRKYTNKQPSKYQSQAFLKEKQTTTANERNEPESKHTQWPATTPH